MATIIDELMITLGIDGKEAKKGMQDVTNSIKGSMQNITSTLQGGFASVSKIFTGFGAAIVGAFSVGSAFSTWKEQAAELGGVSKRLKMSIEDVQGWTGAIGKFGGSAQDFEGTLRGLNGQLARMATIGKSRAGTLLQSLGIDAGEVGRQRNALAVLEDLAGVMEQMAPDEARGIGAALGLDPSTIMLLQQGRDGMKDLIRQKKEDAVYTQEDADAVKAYSVEMGKLKKGFMGIMGVLFRSVLPAFTMVTKYIAQFVNYLRKHQTAIKAFFAMVSALVLGMLLPAFLTFFRTLMANPMTWVILALVALAAVIEDLIVWMDGGESALDDFWEALFGDRENAKKVFADIKDSLNQLWERIKFVLNYIGSGQAWRDMKDHASTALQLIKDRWQILMRNLKQGWENFKRNAMAPFRAMARGIDNLRLGWSQFTADLKTQWTNATNTIAETWQWVQDTIAEGWQGLSDSISEILTWIQTKAAEAWQWVQDKCQEALDWVIKKWNEFKTTALDALNSLFAPINAIAEAIRSVIGGAIDWAITKWQNLKAMVGAGDVYSQSDMSYLGWPSGGNTTNNSSSSVNVGEVHVHGVQNGAQFGRQLSAIQYVQVNGGSL